MDLTTLRDSVARKIGLDNTAGVEQTLLDRWINEGVSDVILRTRCKVSKATITLTSGTADYNLPTQIMAIEEIYNTDANGEIWPLTDRQVSLAEIIKMRRGTNVAPSRYFAISGHNLLHIYPTPGSGETLTVYYVPRPVTLVNGGDIPSDIPTEWHKAIELYALWQAADFDDDQSSGVGQIYRQEYLSYIADIKKSNKRMRSKRLGPAPRAWRRRLPTITDRGIDDGT